jgi:hypothetical protein
MTAELDVNGEKRYQLMIGCLQWAVSLGRFDVLMVSCHFFCFTKRGLSGSSRTNVWYPKTFSNAAFRLGTDTPIVDLPEHEFE